ncbi:mediator of RNA polymerase II transcription subunit 7 [Eurytemora carolleeae]|uniref:mediator of RNA polymerase II transcription subunit 7 n=1 Tax=Eurytemora carolleeae TaxID=1294199 RepID=UPI000C792118|nr:mediator of RNA polymerase II transcription subunit 7 [Eurytemora carolleeae]|eukprot:XP_023335160.1 mediator of RNA polymerase II transcription subunit 7-like [Eurytemora affinis]
MVSGAVGAGGPEVTQVSSMPVPPMHYIKLYTDEAVRKEQVPRPPPPIQDTYSMFGIQINNDDAIIQTLESQGIKKLLPNKDVDRKKELRKLNHSIMLNFLDLLEILIKCPESGKREEKIDDINLLFIHMHHLINEFRPHQARETLRVMLMVQKRRRVQFTSRFKEQLEKVKGIIQEALEALPRRKDEMYSDKDSKGDIKAGLNDGKESEGEEKDVCTSLDRIMCGIVDDTDHGKES